MFVFYVCDTSSIHGPGWPQMDDPPASILQELGIQACVPSPLLHPCFGSYSISHAVPAHRCLYFSHEYSSLLFLTLCSGTLHYFWKTLRHPFPLFLDSPPYRICRCRCAFYEGVSLRTCLSLSRKTVEQPGSLETWGRVSAPLPRLSLSRMPSCFWGKMFFYSGPQLFGWGRSELWNVIYFTKRPADLSVDLI